MVRRAYGYDSYQDMARELIFEPLGMKDTNFGLPKENEDRAVPIKAYVPDTGFLRPEDIEGLNEVITEEAELPWVGATTSWSSSSSTRPSVRVRSRTLRYGSQPSSRPLAGRRPPTGRPALMINR